MNYGASPFAVLGTPENKLKERISTMRKLSIKRKYLPLFLGLLLLGLLIGVMIPFSSMLLQRSAISSSGYG